MNNPEPLEQQDPKIALAILDMVEGRGPIAGADLKSAVEAIESCPGKQYAG